MVGNEEAPRAIIIRRLQMGTTDDSGGYAIAFALLELAAVQDRIATHLKYLGVGDAATTMGAIEYLATAVEKVARAIDGVGDEISSLQTPP